MKIKLILITVGLFFFLCAAHALEPLAIDYDTEGYSYIDFLMDCENVKRAGWDAELELWFPIESPEGGYEIGYGHKIFEDCTLPYSIGMNNKQVATLMVHDLLKAERAASSYFNRKFGDDTWTSMSLSQREMALDYAYNLGTCQTFPKMMKAIYEKDKPTQRREYKRYWRDTKGDRQELRERNRLFYERYLK